MQEIRLYEMEIDCSPGRASMRDARHDRIVANIVHVLRSYDILAILVMTGVFVISPATRSVYTVQCCSSPSVLWSSQGQIRILNLFAFLARLGFPFSC